MNIKTTFSPISVLLLFSYNMCTAQMWNAEYQSKNKTTTELKSRTSSIPNDPLLFPNDMMPYHQYHLNIQANGFSIDYPATWQYARGHALVGIHDQDIYALHPDLTGNYRQHLSANGILTEEPPILSGTNIFYDHGSWVLGVLAPTSNNNEGLTGVCQDCSVTAELLTFDAGGFLSMASQGVQVINMSWGGSNDDINCSNEPVLCNVFENEMAERDIVLVAISQNRHNWVNQDLYDDTFPGAHPNVIQVGGLNQSLQFWDDCEGFTGTSTCGSLASKYQELVVPAKNILTAITYTEDGVSACGEVSSPPHVNYDICSGNSFAAPQVTGLIGIMRSIYPQLSAANIRLLLQKTAQSPHAERHDEWGYGLINPLRVVTEVLGKVATVQQTNRSIPFFVVRHISNTWNNDTAYSSVPQFIAATLSDDFRNGYELNYQPLNVGMALNDYRIPSSNILPYAAFHILGTHNNPLIPGKELLKLYRLSKWSDGIPLTPPILDHAYVTSAYIEQFKDAGYEIDTIEGYIFPPCDVTDNSCQAPAHSECLIARNTSDGDDWAIMLESQLTHEVYQNHTVKLNGTTEDICLGYAYQSVDSDNDGLIDGYEAFLGTNINQADSDSDGRSDGEEMLEPIDAFFSDPMSHANPFAINAGLTGSWYYQETSGQGLLLDVMRPENNKDGRIFAAWFTYDLTQKENTTEFGSINHRWFTAQGTYVDDNADLTIYLTDGGRFDDPQAVNSVAVGQMNIRFTSCTAGTVNYLFNQTDISGSFPITRLSPDQFCEDDNSASIAIKSNDIALKNIETNGGLSGAWYNPQTSGQGLLFDVMESREQIFAAWFNYSIEGDSPDVNFGSGNHRWFTAQGDWSNNGSEMTIYLTQGGVFDSPSTVTSEAVGTLKVDFDSCTTGTVEYQFPNLAINGNFPIQRITPNVFCQD